MSNKKGIKIVGEDYMCRYTTRDKVYEATFWDKGDTDNEGVYVDKPALSFVDDEGDVVGLYVGNPAYGLVEGDE